MKTSAKKKTSPLKINKRNLQIDSVSREIGKIELEYSYTNTSTQAVWIFGPLFEQETNGTLTKSPTKVYVEAERKILVISKRLIEIPNGIRVESPEVPALTQVLPKQTIKGRAIVNLPLRESLPYKRDRSISIVGISKFRFVLGTLSSYSGGLSRGKDGLGQTYTMPSYGPALMNQSLSQSALVDLP